MSFLPSNVNHRFLYPSEGLGPVFHKNPSLAKSFVNCPKSSASLAPGYATCSRCSFAHLIVRYQFVITYQSRLEYSSWNPNPTQLKPKQETRSHLRVLVTNVNMSRRPILHERQLQTILVARLRRGEGHVEFRHAKHCLGFLKVKRG